MSQGSVAPLVISTTPAADAFATLRRELFHHHPLVGNFDSSALYTDKDEQILHPYRAQLHNDVRPSPYTVRSGNTDLLTWYTRIEFAPTPLLLSLLAYPSPSDVVAQGEQIAFLRSICRKRLPLEPERLLSFMGTSPYANSYVAWMFPHSIAAHGHTHVVKVIHKRLAGTHAPQLVALLLDLAAQNTLPLLADEKIMEFADQWAKERVVLHALWRYLATRTLGGEVQAYLSDCLRADLPVYDRLLVLELLRGQGLPLTLLGGVVADRPHPLLEAYLTPHAIPIHGFAVAQSMLMGRFARPGEGNSGGLAVFLSNLGSTLANHKGVERMVTLTLADEVQLENQRSLINEITPGHWVLSLPLPLLHEADQHDMMHHESTITWWARQLLIRYRLVPDVVHVRYADNGSLAIAHAAKQLGAKVVFTVTPDPHRTMAKRYMEAPLPAIATHDALLFDLHKIFVADMLMREADGLVGIPGRADSEHLTRYFPQLTLHHNHRAKPLKVIAEGVTVWEAPGDFIEAGQAILQRLYAPHTALPRLNSAHCHRPVLLNVGRFSPVKQQDKLVMAWIESGAWRHFNLVLVGGNPTTPTAAEREILTAIQDLLIQYPDTAGRIALLPAMSNQEVRLLKAALVRLAPATLPHIYLCSSVKEEFGIAILEAMDAGLLAVGPQRGGLNSYLQDGVNGFLINTATTDSLTHSLRSLLHNAFLYPTRFHTIAAAGTQTMRDHFDIRQIAVAFGAYYHEVAGRYGVTASGKQKAEMADFP
jgi:D-inositol-3-phosphate glycosyltransferase